MKFGATVLFWIFYAVACSSSSTNPEGDGGSGGTSGGASGGSSSGGADGSVACDPNTCTISCCLGAYPNQANTLSAHINKDICGCEDCTPCPACACSTSPASAVACYKCLLDQPLAVDVAGSIQTDCSLSNQCSALLDCIGQCSAGDAG